MRKSLINKSVCNKSEIKSIYYVFEYTDTNLDTRFGQANKKVDRYFNTCARNTYKFTSEKKVCKVPFTRDKFKDAVDFVKEKFYEIDKNLYDIFIYVCSPNRSHTGGTNVQVSPVWPNLVHEFGHALGLTHAINSVTGKSIDPFGIMLFGSAYKSPNCLDLCRLKFIKEEEVNKGITYYLYEISSKKPSLCLKYGTQYISYCSKKDELFLAVYEDKDGRSNLIKYGKDIQIEGLEIDYSDKQKLKIKVL